LTETVDRNKETFVDGWVRTGDEASIDKDNWVFVHDRLKVLAGSASSDNETQVCLRN
jgi:long-subunit acyl-CoA synthetase (AMP-forming)